MLVSWLPSGNLPERMPKCHQLCERIPVNFLAAQCAGDICTPRQLSTLVCLPVVWYALSNRRLAAARRRTSCSLATRAKKHRLRRKDGLCTSTSLRKQRQSGCADTPQLTQMYHRKLFEILKGLSRHPSGLQQEKCARRGALPERAKGCLPRGAGLIAQRTHRTLGAPRGLRTAVLHLRASSALWRCPPGMQDMVTCTYPMFCNCSRASHSPVCGWLTASRPSAHAEPRALPLCEPTPALGIQSCCCGPRGRPAACRSPS